MYDERFEVDRVDYKNFFQTLKPDCKKIEEKQLDGGFTAVETYSVKNNKYLASRVYNIEDDSIPEKYYIFELPDADEVNPPLPYTRIVLDSKEQVQAFFDCLSKSKEEENDRAV